MIHVYRADSSAFVKNKSQKSLLQLLPECMHARALRYKFEQDTYNFILGRLLLKKGLEAFGMFDHLQHISYLESGKPYLKDVFFSISHSENLVLCALTKDGEIGIDIEKVKPVKLTDFNSWFSAKEWQDIYTATVPLEKFYWYWTRKESIIKALGVDLPYLHRIELDASHSFFMDQEKKWNLSSIQTKPGFVGAICAEEEIKILVYQEIDVFDV